MMSSPDIGKILDNSKELDRLRKEQEEVLLEINKMHKKLQSSEFTSLTLIYTLIYSQSSFLLELLVVLSIIVNCATLVYLLI